MGQAVFGFRMSVRGRYTVVADDEKAAYRAGQALN